jgi:precorrin-6Y C5,15-methyltransferase (decarboxylating)
MSAVAIEREPVRAALIARNAAVLGVPGLQIVTGAAPQALTGLTSPDAIFVGGGIGEPNLLPALWQALRPGGRLIANVVSIEGERTLLDWQARHGGTLTRLAASRAEKLGGHHLWRPLIAVTQLAVSKPG